MKNYDVLIIGSGPAGMNAAVYASRLNLSTGIIEKGAPGGKLVYISKIDNYLGFDSESGPDIALKMNAHALKYGAESIYGNVSKINEKENVVELESGDKIGYKYLIIATGTVDVVPEDIKGIHEYNTKGVSYCAICDGPLYKGKITSVIGGGNSAIEEATYLANVAKEVHIFVRSTIKADAQLTKELSEKKNAFIHLGEKITEIHGDGKVEAINTTIGDMKMDAIFPYIGLKPSVSFIKETSIKTQDKFILVDETMKTSVDNIFAIGDVIHKHVRQISTAIADGTIAAKIIGNLI